MPELIQFIQEVCNTIQREEDIIKLEWENQLLTAEFWFDLAVQVNCIIDRYGNKLGRSSRLFANKFFTGPVIIIIVHAMQKYDSAKLKKAKFIKAVELLFN
jgi:hypothetical protein